jgi:hypothetical protein
MGLHLSQAQHESLGKQSRGIRHGIDTIQLQSFAGMVFRLESTIGGLDVGIHGGSFRQFEGTIGIRLHQQEVFIPFELKIEGCAFIHGTPGIGRQQHSTLSTLAKVWYCSHTQ